MAASVFLACLVAMGQAAEQSRTAKSQPPGTFQVKVSKDNLSLEANQAPLVQIFQEIGKQAKITFDSNIGPEEKITIHLDQVPLEEGIKQLAKNVTVFYTENPKDKTRRISTGGRISPKEAACLGKPKRPHSRKKLRSLLHRQRPLKSPRRSLSRLSSSSILESVAKEKPGKQP